MNAETFQIISIIGFTMMGLFFVISFVIFIVFDIPSIIGELSGRTAAKQVAEIRKQNREGNKKRVLNNNNSVVVNNEIIAPNIQETTVLQGEEQIDETELLQEETVILETETELLGFSVIQDVMQIHTKEEM